MLQMSSLILCSQTTSTDSLSFSKEQAVKIMQDLKRLDLCDSINQNQELQIINFKEVLKVNDKIILENKERLAEVTKTLNNTKFKLKISKRLSTIGIPVAICGGAAIVLLLK